MKNDIASYWAFFLRTAGCWLLAASGMFWTEAHITNIAVSLFTGGRVGRLLMNCLISRAVSYGCRHLTLGGARQHIAPAPFTRL
jgi:hypothetical protein